MLRAGVSGSYVPRLHCCLAPCLLCYSIFPLDFSSALPDCHVPSLQCLNSFACWSLCGAKSMDPSRQDHWRCRVECCTIKCCCPGCIKPLKFKAAQMGSSKELSDWQGWSCSQMTGREHIWKSNTYQVAQFGTVEYKPAVVWGETRHELMARCFNCSQLTAKCSVIV